MEKTEIKIDYFSATFPLACDEEDDIQLRVYELIKLIGIYLNVQGYEVKKNQRSHNNFKYEFTLGAYIFLRCDGPLNHKYQRTCQLEMKGEGCRDFEIRNKDKTWVNLILFMVQLNAQFKRIDLAIDDYEGKDITIPYLIQKISKGQYTSVFKSPPLVFGSQKTGHTIQFGSNASTQQLVIYDKYLEQKRRNKTVSHTYWVRYEMRFRQQNAKTIAYLISTLYPTQNETPYGLELQRLANEQLYRILDIKQDNNYSEENQTRAKTDPHWLSFINNVEKGTLRKPIEPPPTLEAYTKTALPYAITLILIQYILANKDIYLFLLDILKLLHANLDFSKERFYKLNTFLKQLSQTPLDNNSLLELKTLLQNQIEEQELPF